MPSRDLKAHFVHQRQQSRRSYRDLASPYISSSTGHRAEQEFKQHGYVLQARKSTGRPRTLSPLALEFILVTIRQRPSIYLDELITMLECFYGDLGKIDRSNFSRLLKRIGFTHKKLSAYAQQRDEEERRRYVQLIGQFDPRQLIFADESGINNRSALRTRGWARRGQHAIERQLLVRGQKYSLLPALSLDGLFAISVFPGSVNGDQFCAWVETELMPWMNRFPLPRSVLVIDNCSTHKRAELRELLEVKGHFLIYLPAYSPGYNPIELAFASIKRKIQRDFDPPIVETAIIRTARETVTAAHASAYFRSCGYSAAVEM